MPLSTDIPAPVNATTLFERWITPAVFLIRSSTKIPPFSLFAGMERLVHSIRVNFIGKSQPKLANPAVFLLGHGPGEREEDYSPP
jgi:hypothetical protein